MIAQYLIIYRVEKVTSFSMDLISIGYKIEVIEAENEEQLFQAMRSHDYNTHSIVHCEEITDKSMMAKYLNWQNGRK